jgi:hypothetical protein
MDAIIHKKNPIQITMNTQRSMSGSPPILIPLVVHGNGVSATGVSATGDTPRTDDTVDTVIFGSFANALFRFCCVTDADILVTISAETVTDVSTSNPVVSRRRIGETRSVSRVIETVDGITVSACATPLMYAIDTDKVKSVRSICSVTANDITNMSGLGVVSGVVLVVVKAGGVVVLVVVKAGGVVVVVVEASGGVVVVVEASGGVVVVVKASGGVVVVVKASGGVIVGFIEKICRYTLSVTPATRSSYLFDLKIPVNCTSARFLYVFAVVASMTMDRVSAVTVL